MIDKAGSDESRYDILFDVNQPERCLQMHTSAEGLHRHARFIS